MSTPARWKERASSPGPASAAGAASRPRRAPTGGGEAPSRAWAGPGGGGWRGGARVPVRAARYDADAYYVNGTPTDCVHLAISGLFDFEHDIVVSGVNDGANLGDDTLYSGTVAAAVEGRFLGLPAIAVSLCVEPGSPRNFAAAAHVAAQLVQKMSQDRLPGPDAGPIILNVNVPDLPDGQLRGIKVTRLGSRHRSKPIVKAKDPRGRNVYWVGNAGTGQDAGPGTDFHAVAEGFASITPLQIDLTRHAALPQLQKWLKLE